MSLLGGLVGGLGSALHLPEFGFSEALGGDKVWNGNNGGSTGAVLGANTNRPAGQSVVAPTTTTKPTTVLKGGSTGGSSGSGAGSASDVAYYTDQINALQGLLGAADTQQNTGTNAINTAINNNLSRLNQQQSNTLSGYATQRQDTTGDYQNARNQIADNSRSTYNSLQRLLGQQGSGVSSAAQVLAPYAVSRDSTKKGTQASQGFAKNLRDIDTAQTQAVQSYDNARQDLDSQKNQKLQALLGSINAQKQNYLSQIGTFENQKRIAAGGKYATPTAQNSQIAALQAQLNGLGSQYADPTFNVQEVKAAAPNLGQYEAQAAALGDGSNAGVPVDDASYLPSLVKLLQDQDQYSY